jgi:hypothetical protein
MRLFSPKYYTLCTGDGLLAATTNHLAITPRSMSSRSTCR